MAEGAGKAGEGASGAPLLIAVVAVLDLAAGMSVVGATITSSSGGSHGAARSDAEASMSSCSCSRKSQRHTCQICLNVPARFLYRGRVCARIDHDLCPRCYRSVMDSERVRPAQEG